MGGVFKYARDNYKKNYQSIKEKFISGSYFSDYLSDERMFICLISSNYETLRCEEINCLFADSFMY